jgi:hypothetical protein
MSTGGFTLPGDQNTVPAEQGGINQPLRTPTYSKMLRSIGSLQSMKAPGQQWLGTLRGKGVKPEELATLQPRLATEAQPKLTAREVMDYARVGLPKISEQWKDEDPDREEHPANSPDPDQARYGPGRSPGLNLPGGANYRELLLRLPKDEYTDYQSSHWPGSSNVFAHARMDERRLDEPTYSVYGPDHEKVGPDFANANEAREWGVAQRFANTGHRVRENDRGPNDTLFLQELQSDWHQAAAGVRAERIKQLIKDGTPVEQALKETPVDYGYRSDWRKPGELRPSRLGMVPDAPFKGTGWQELMLKRLVVEAARKGFNKLAWTSGKDQADRYDLATHVDRLLYRPDENGGGHLGGYKDNQLVLDEPIKHPKELHGIIGREMADKLLVQPRVPIKGSTGDWHSLAGLDLHLGGEEKTRDYDVTMPRLANRLFGKHGAKVQQHTIHLAKQNIIPFTGRRTTPHTVHVLHITPELRKHALEHGFELFHEGGLVDKRASGGRVDRSHDVPYLAGQSKSGRCTYIDRRVPHRLTVAGRELDPAKYLKVHEEHEHRLMKGGMAYEPAHRSALKEERKAIEADGHNWASYQAQMHRMAHVTEHEKPRHPPPDLFTKGVYPTKQAAQLERKGRPDHFKEGGQVSPAVSKDQYRLFAAVKHSPAFAKKVGISQSVGREFVGKPNPKAYAKLPARIGRQGGGSVFLGGVSPVHSMMMSGLLAGLGLARGGPVSSLQRMARTDVGYLPRGGIIARDADQTHASPGRYNLETTRRAGDTVHQLYKTLPSGAKPWIASSPDPHEILDQIPNRARGGWIKDWIGQADTFPHTISYDSAARGYRWEHPMLGKSEQVHPTPAAAGDEARAAIKQAVAQRARGGYLPMYRHGGAAPTPYLGTTTHSAEPYAPKIGHVGGLLSPVAGRTDHIPLDVPNGAYVLPADVISGMGQGNTIHGIRVANHMFHGSFHKPRMSGAHHGLGRSAGGVSSGGPSDDTVPIMAAGGEYVIPPEAVSSLGRGDMKHGHAILDAFVKKQRAKTIKTLQKLPGPAKK